MKKIFILALSLLATTALFAQSDEDLLQRDLFSNYGGWKNLTAGYTFDTIGAEPMKSEIAISGQTVHVVWAGYRNDYQVRPEGYGVWYRRSTDGGVTWEEARSLYQRRDETWFGFSNMMVVDGENVHMVVPDNDSNESPNQENAMLVYLHSSDGGATFEKVYLDTVAVGYYSYTASIVRSDGNNVVIAAHEYRNYSDVLVIFRSTDNGATFERLELDMPATITRLGDLQMKGDRWAVLWSHEWTWDATVYITIGDMTGDTRATTILSPQIGDRHYGILCKQYGQNGDDYNFHPMMAITGDETIHVLFHGLRAEGEEEGDPYHALYVRSDDFGQTWGEIQKLEGTRNEHSMLVAKGQNVYAVVGNSYNRWIAYSNDGGGTWKQNTTMCYGSTYGSNYDSPRAYTLVIDPNDPTGNTAWYMGAKWLAVQTKDGFNTLSYSTRLCSYIRNNVPSYRGSQMAPLLAIDEDGINHWLMREFVGTEVLDRGWDRPVCQLFYRKETAEPDPQDKNMAWHVQETKNAVPHNRIVIPQRESLKIDSALSVGFWIRIDSLTMSTPIISVKPNMPQTSGDDQLGGPYNFYSPGWGIGFEYGGAYSEERGAWDDTQTYVRGYICTDKSPDGAGLRMGSWAIYDNQGYQVRQSGLWHYVAMTWDGRLETKENAHLYIDGMPMGSGYLIGAIETGTNPIVLGPEWGGFGLPANQDWYLDELQIWTRALTREEVYALSNHQPVSSEGCIVNYGFDGTLKDLSGHGNDALAQLNCNMEEFEGLQLPHPQMQITKDWSKRTATFTDRTEDGEAIYWFFDDPFLHMGDGNCGTTSRHTQHEYYEPGVCNPVMVARGGNACAPVSEQIIIAGLNKVEPSVAGQANGVRVKIYGGYEWYSGLNVRLHQEGQEDIIGAWVKREGYNDDFTTASEKLHFANFNLAQAEVGTWDVIVGEDTLKQAFTVEPFAAPDVWANIEGWSKMLINKAKDFTIEYGNRGNVDAYNVPLFIFVSEGAEVTLGFESPMYTDAMSEQIKQVLKDSVGEYRVIDAGEYGALKCYGFIIPRIPANSYNYQTIYVKSEHDVDLFYLLSEPWGIYMLDENGNVILADKDANSPDIRRMPADEIDDIIDGGGGGYGGMGGGGFGGGSAECMIGYLGWGVLDATISALPFAGCAWGIGKTVYQGFTDKPGDRLGNIFTNTLGTAFSCAMDFNPLGWGMRATTLASFAFNTAMNINSVNGCIGGSGGGKNVRAVGSYDPNEMIGPSGFGDDHYMKPRPEMSYTITFENKSSATAPAHEVFVTDTLDAELYDFEAFGFTSFGWADTIVRVDGEKMKEFVQEVDLRPAKELLVRVTGTFDEQTGIAQWSFVSLNPATKQYEEDPDLGFLVPNNDNHEGEGFVSFALNHLMSLSDGTAISNEATIVFDANEAIKTNRYVNTIDSADPTSKAIHAERVGEGKVAVTWEASDAASGIAFVELYRAVDDEPYELVDTYDATLTSAVIDYEQSRTYCFATIARDNVGWNELKSPSDLTCEARFTSVDIDNVNADTRAGTKFLRDGHLFILLPDGKTFDATGAEVK